MRLLAVLPAMALGLAAATISGIPVADMDTTCKPCTDFWRYVNGNWIDKNPIPARLTSWGPMPALREANEERTRTILENAHGTKMGTLYESCMDTAAADKRGLAPLQPDLDAIAKIQTLADLNETIARFQFLAQPAAVGNGSVVGPFKVVARADVKNPERVIPTVVERDGTNGISSILSLPDREYYSKADARSQAIRADFLKHVTSLLGGPGAEKILAFETSLAESVLDVAARRDAGKTYHLMTAAELNALTPNFDWKLLLQRLNIAEGTSINVSEPDLVKKMNQMLTDVPLDDWKLWLHWRVIAVSAPILSTSAVDEDFHFNRTILNGVAEKLPRWQTCAAAVDRDLPDALGEAYIRKYFPPEARRRMAELVENIRAAMRTDLEHTEWMQPATRAYAIRKLDAVKVKIGSADHWRDYSSIPIAAGTWFENERAAWAYARGYNLGRIGKPLDRTEFRMTPPTVNASSSPTLVELIFPAGILQPPFFDMNADDASNYGAIGAVIGHELGHQFDDNGSKYDITGTLKDWWSPEDRMKFDGRAACVVNQFDNLDIGDGRRHNGKLILGEALGDLGGLSVSLHAYHVSLKGKPAPVLDGFTGEQRFFIAFAHTWGSQMRPEAERVSLSTNPHPLAKSRAIATLQNMPEFHRAFQCKPGDPMVRSGAEQCKLW